MDSGHIKADVLELELKDLRRNGFSKYIDHMGGLLCKMGCRITTSIELKEARFIALVQQLVTNKLDVEILLAAMGLLQGFDVIKKLKDRRELYCSNGFPETAYTEADSFLRKREDGIIERLVISIAAADDLPSLLAKIQSKVSLPSPQYYEMKIHEPVKPMDKRGPFARYIDSEHPLGGHQSSFDYRSGAVPFCCRENELEQIDRFCADNKTVLWWAITGSGGTGKSRLAYEYIRTRVSDDWKALFLRDEFFAQVEGGGKYQQFNEWTHPKHLLLVIDYVQRYSKAVAQWLESVIAKKTGGNKIRVLLIERSGETGLWYRDFVDRAGVAPHCYGDFLALQPLADEELAQIARKYAKAQKITFSEKDIKWAIAEFGHIDGEHRVLYFMMLLDYLHNEKAMPDHSNKLDLLAYVTRREIKTLQARFCGNNGAFKQYMRLLLYATVAGGISVTNPPDFLREQCSDIFAAFPDASSAMKAMGAADGLLHPFTPNLIGEYLCLTALTEYFPFEAEQDEFARTAWEECHETLVDFLSRLAMDFTAEEEQLPPLHWLKKLLDGPSVADNPANFAYYTLLTSMAVYLHKPFMMSLQECLGQMTRIAPTGEREKYILQFIATLRSKCLTFRSGTEACNAVLNLVDIIVSNRSESKEIMLACTRLLEDIAAMQSKRIEVQLLFGANPEVNDILETNELRYDEKGSPELYIAPKVTIDDFEVFIRILDIVKRISELDSCKGDEEIAAASPHVQTLFDLAEDCLHGLVP